jgi:hypothetical protein
MKSTLTLKSVVNAKTKHQSIVNLDDTQWARGNLAGLPAHSVCRFLIF